MTDLWMWGLIASLILLATGTTLKSAHDAFLLKQSDKEVARLRSKIESFNKTNHETICGIRQSNATDNEELVNRVTELEKQLDHQRKKPMQYRSNGGSCSWMG